MADSQDTKSKDRAVTFDEDMIEGTEDKTLSVTENEWTKKLNPEAGKVEPEAEKGKPGAENLKSEKVLEAKTENSDRELEPEKEKSKGEKEKPKGEKEQSEEGMAKSDPGSARKAKIKAKFSKLKQSYFKTFSKKSYFRRNQEFRRSTSRSMRRRSKSPPAKVTFEVGPQEDEEEPEHRPLEQQNQPQGACALPVKSLLEMTLFTSASNMDDDEKVATSVNGRFHMFREEIGRGSFKAVHKAYDTNTGDIVAWCELLDDRMSRAERLRFRDEAEMLKTLDHANIVKFYEFFEKKRKGMVTKRCFVLVTELMTSGTLRTYLKRFKKINTKVIKSWCRQILKGLQFLHSRNPAIIHRDIKCDNIFIAGPTGSVKIGDLGLATFKNKTFAKSVIGTPEFMAPEMYDEYYNESVDIYAFGMCMLEMATSEYPYKECTVPGLVYRKVANGVLPQGLKKVEDPEVYEQIVHCIARNPANRKSARQLLQTEFFKDPPPRQVDTGFRLEIQDREEMLSCNDLLIRLRLRVTDQERGLKPVHRTDEAIEFVYNLQEDDPLEVANVMLSGGILISEEDVRILGRMMATDVRQFIRDRKQRLQSINSAAQQQLEAVGPGLVSAPAPVANDSTQGASERVKQPYLVQKASRKRKNPVIEVKTVLKQANGLKVICHLESILRKRVIFEFATDDVAPEEIATTFISKGFLTELHRAAVAEVVSSIVNQLMIDPTLRPKIRLHKDMTCSYETASNSSKSETNATPELQRVVLPENQEIDGKLNATQETVGSSIITEEIPAQEQSAQPQNIAGEAIDDNTLLAEASGGIEPTEKSHRFLVTQMSLESEISIGCETATPSPPESSYTNGSDLCHSVESNGSKPQDEALQQEQPFQPEQTMQLVPEEQQSLDLLPQDQQSLDSQPLDLPPQVEQPRDFLPQEEPMGLSSYGSEQVNSGSQGSSAEIDALPQDGPLSSKHSSRSTTPGFGSMSANSYSVYGTSRSVATSDPGCQTESLVVQTESLVVQTESLVVQNSPVSVQCEDTGPSEGTNSGPSESTNSGPSGESNQGEPLDGAVGCVQQEEEFIPDQYLPPMLTPEQVFHINSIHELDNAHRIQMRAIYNQMANCQQQYQLTRDYRMHQILSGLRTNMPPLYLNAILPQQPFIPELGLLPNLQANPIVMPNLNLRPQQVPLRPTLENQINGSQPDVQEEPSEEANQNAAENGDYNGNGEDDSNGNENADQGQVQTRGRFQIEQIGGQLPTEPVEERIGANTGRFQISRVMIQPGQNGVQFGDEQNGNQSGQVQNGNYIRQDQNGAQFHQAQNGGQIHQAQNGAQIYQAQNGAELHQVQNGAPNHRSQNGTHKQETHNGHQGQNDLEKTRF